MKKLVTMILAVSIAIGASTMLLAQAGKEAPKDAPKEAPKDGKGGGKGKGKGKGGEAPAETKDGKAKDTK
jgi:hypothetical protein